MEYSLPDFPDSPIRFSSLITSNQRIEQGQRLLVWTCKAYHFLCSLLSIHEAFRDDPRCEDLVALAEFLEEDAVGESETADTDALQDTVAA